MRQFFIFVNFIFFYCSANSLTAQENTHLNTIADTVHARLLIKQGNITRKTSADSALILFKKALMISRQMRDNEGSAIALLNIGECFLYDKEDYSKSKQVLYEAMPYCHKPSAEKLLAALYNNLGSVNSKQGYHDSAIHFYNLALAEINNKKIVDTLLLIDIYANIGTRLSVLQQTDKSDRAIYYISKSMQLSKELRYTKKLAQNYANMGLTFEVSKKKPCIARKYYDSALQIFKNEKQLRYISTLYYYIGISWGREGNSDMAKIYFDSAVWADKNFAEHNAGIQKAFGDFYLETYNYLKAISFYERALKIAIQKGLTSDRLDIYYHLADSYYKTGNVSVAYAYQKAYADLKDSLLDEKQIQSVNQMEVQYRTSEKDKELAQRQLIIFQQEGKLKQKNLWISVIIISTVLSIALAFFIFLSSRRKQQVAILNLQQSRLKALMQGEETERKRIARELHDGIGSLISAAKLHLKNTTGNVAQKDTYESGLSLLDDAYNELRRTSHNLVPEQLLEEGLVNAVQAYCDRINQPPSFIVSFLNSGDEPVLAAEQSLSLYRIIQELVQNAHKHGQATKVTIQLNHHDQQLYISVEDNGSGLLPVENEKEKQGIGLQTLKERISLFGGSMEIDNRPGMGMTVYVEVKTG